MFCPPSGVYPLARVTLSSCKQALATVFIDTRLWKTKHPRKHFQNFRQYCVLSTDRIEIHQSQPLVWPSNLLHASGLWLVDLHVWLTEILETFPRVFCFRKTRINENGGNIRGSGSEYVAMVAKWLSLYCGAHLVESHCKNCTFLIQIGWDSFFIICDHNLVECMMSSLG